MGHCLQIQDRGEEVLCSLTYRGTSSFPKCPFLKDLSCMLFFVYLTPVEPEGVLYLVLGTESVQMQWRGCRETKGKMSEDWVSIIEDCNERVVGVCKDFQVSDWAAAFLDFFKMTCIWSYRTDSVFTYRVHVFIHISTPTVGLNFI